MTTLSEGLGMLKSGKIDAETYDRLSISTPQIAKVNPASKYDMEDFHRAERWTTLPFLKFRLTHCLKSGSKRLNFEKRIGGKKMTNKSNGMRNWWWQNSHRKGFVHR